MDGGRDVRKSTKLVSRSYVEGKQCKEIKVFFNQQILRIFKEKDFHTNSGVKGFLRNVLKFDQKTRLKQD